MAVQVRPVEGRRELKAFLRFPRRIYRQDPLWVPPLERELTPFFTGEHPFRLHASITPFLALKDGEPVGRIAAIVDRRFIDYHRSKTGYFGFFEAVDDLEVAGALMEAAEAHLRREGMAEMIGPMNPSTNYECGMLVEGFETPPYIMMPHNPPYYPRLMEALRLKKARDLYANLIIGDGSVPARIERIAQWAAKKVPGLEIREVRKTDFQGEVRRFMKIYHEAWAQNWGFVPMSEEEVAFMARQLEPIIVTELGLFAEVRGEPVGFILALPNYNRVLKALGGRLTPWGLFKALWLKRKIDELRILLLGVRPQYQRRGIETLLYVEVFRRGWHLGYRRAEMSWILEDNHLMQKGVEAMGGRRYKTYRIWQREL